jgi:alpha-amylase
VKQLHIALLFEAHQPIRLKRLNESLPPMIPDNIDEIFDYYTNDLVLDRVSERTYRNATKIIKNSIKELKEYKVNFSISGILLEQLNKKHKDIIDIFKEIGESDNVEFISQTYYHSLAWFIDKREFYDQIKMDSDIIKEIFGYKPRAAENTEFIYNNDIGCFLKDIGFDTVVTEGVDYILNGRSPNYLYYNPQCNNKVVLRNYRLSDDIGFRFSNRNWDQYPLTAEKYATWINETPGDFVFVAIDYETFGEHHNPSTGIYNFLEWLPREIIKRKIGFLNISEIKDKFSAKDSYDVPPWNTISWADERDLSAWLGNEMQKESFNLLRKLYYYSKPFNNILETYRKLTISDHLYYIAKKYGPTGEVHNYFNPQGNAEKAFQAYTMALTLLQLKTKNEIEEKICEFLKNVDLPSELCFYFKEYKACSFREFLKIKETNPLLIKEYENELKTWLKDIFMVNNLDEITNYCNL